jgi:ABC-2 type transport system permease protein
MTVFRRRYEPYDGEWTPRHWRFLVPTRYALEELTRSRALLGFAFIAALPPLVGLSVVYLLHNPAARVLLGLMKLTELLRVDAEFFVQALSTQCFFGFVLAAWIGPNLIGGDLANGAMPLYLSRPLSRVEYVFGKLLVILGLGSAVTWMPLLLLYVENGILAGNGWWYSHARIALGLVVGGTLWCTVIALYTLALSAWIQWRLLASSTSIGLYLVSSGFGEALEHAARTPWGRLLNFGHTFRMIWTQLMGTKPLEPALPTLAAWALVALVTATSMAILALRVRAREISR